MTYDQFWNDDVELVNDFVKAENIRQAKLNNQLWLQGIYNRIAIASCLSKSAKYPSQPFPMTELEIEASKRKKVEKLRNALKAKSRK